MNVYDYETADGKDLINEYLDNLPPDERAQGFRIKSLLEEEGLLALSELNTRQLRKKLWKINFDYKDRFMHVVADADNLYILHACKKQKGKAKEFEMQTAIRRAKELGKVFSKGVIIVPFRKVNVKEEVDQRLDSDPEFKEAYKKVDQEYELIKQVIKMRKDMGISQNKLAEESGLKQQVVSRIETIGNSPTLRNFLKYLDAMGLEIKIEKKH